MQTLSPATSTIYCVLCCVNNKRYVGQTRYSLDLRWKRHVSFALRRNSNLPFHRAIRKYGPDSFLVSVIELVSIKLANKKEIYWIKKLQSLTEQHGYNSTGGGDCYSVSPSVRKKISKGLRGRRLSKIHKERVSKSLTGKILSESHKLHIKIGRLKYWSNSKTRSKLKEKWIKKHPLPNGLEKLYLTSTITQLSKKLKVGRSVIKRWLELKWVKIRKGGPLRKPFHKLSERSKRRRLYESNLCL